MSKDNWWKDASYINTITVDRAKTQITFHFPNAAGGDLKFTTWLYKFKPKGQWSWEKIETNMAAEMLQCYIDRERDVTPDNPS